VARCSVSRGADDKDKPAEKPAEKVVEKPVDKPAEKPVEKPEPKPVEKTKPVEKAVEKPKVPEKENPYKVKTEPKVEPKKDLPKVDLTGFRTVDEAVTTKIGTPVDEKPKKPAGRLGVHVDINDGKVVVAEVEPNSSAAKADIKTGDVIVKVEGRDAADLEAVRSVLVGRDAGDTVMLAIVRDGKPADRKVTFDPASRPLSSPPRAILGIQMGPSPKGAKVEQVMRGLPAAEAGVKTGDIVTKADGTEVKSPEALTNVLSKRKVGDTVKLTLLRGEQTVELSAKLAADPTSGRPVQTGTGLPIHKAEVYKLAVIAIEYPDTKHNEKLGPKEWEQALFSKDSYRLKSPTGQDVYGSLNDYYHEQSLGRLKVEGKMFPYVEVKKKRAEYGNDSNRQALLVEAVDKVLERDGKAALDGFDGIFFLYAGDRLQSVRGGLYWPHRAFFQHGRKRWSYFICPEGGAKMASISVIAHEFGHMLGMPDLYAKPELPGAEGLGVWCTMSTGHGRDGKPLHFSAWCKETLGWLKPTVIDPSVKQKLILEPIEGSDKQCYKVLVNPDGSEYLLLENRIKRGYDRDLPAEGLLIWRVVDGRPILEESHGIITPDGPQRFLGSVPYPSPSNTAFTPTTTPSSRALKTGGKPVHITNIRKLGDGRITFYIGYEFL